MYNWDYDKLFSHSNVVCVKDTSDDEMHYWVINKSDDNLTPEYIKYLYANENLSCVNKWKVMWIIRLDDNGNIAERLFDRERDMAEPMPEPMPELKTGVFGKALWWENGEFEVSGSGFGNFVTVNDKIIYQSGGYDYVWDERDELCSDGCTVVVEIYESNYGFDDDKVKVIWQNPMYTEWLKTHKYKDESEEDN